MSEVHVIKSKRSFGLGAEEVKALTEAYVATGKVPNPYRAGGCYANIISALISLGADKPHNATAVMSRMRQAGGREWAKAWTTKEARTEEGLDAQGRFLQNLRVLQRTADYGRKLLEVGTKVMKTKGVAIDLTRDDHGGILVRLNTDSDTPKKPGRAVKVKTPVKGTKPKAKGKKAGKAK